MAIQRDDRWLTDAQGRALAGAEVYYCLQPATTTTDPPSPLATIYSNTTGTVEAQPLITDGFGHTEAYLTAGVLYTVVLIHPLFGDNPVVLTDQAIVSAASSSSRTPVEPTPDANGVVRAFVLPTSPVSPTDGQLFVAGSYALYGTDYTITDATITWIGATPPQTGDILTYFGT